MARSIDTRALLVRHVPYGESDVVATWLTEAEGKVASIVRGARKNAKRIGGALEPFHTVELRMDDRGGELATVREAKIVRVRAKLVSSLEAIDAAGTALRWARHACPPRTREPEAFATVLALLDALDEGKRAPKVELAVHGLKLLGDVGYGLDLERCVRCGKECPDSRPACVDASHGGLVCASCGGSPVVLGPELRAKAIAAQVGEIDQVEALDVSVEDSELLLGLVDRAMAAHAGFDR